MISSARFVFLCALASALGFACRAKEPEKAPAPLGSVSAAPRASGSIGPPEPLPPPRQGMVWIPGGALVAGTPRAELPRKVDEEMPGEQVILHGFYIDVFPYPDEEGAIPLTNVSQSQAEKVLFAGSSGELAFGLLTGNSTVRPGPGTNAGNLFK